MIQVSQQYKEACSSTNRPKSFITAKYGTFDKNIKNNVNNIVGIPKKFSNINKLNNEIKSSNYNYISCEPDRVKLDSTFCFINDKTKSNDNENIAYWSYVMSDENKIIKEGSNYIDIKFKEKVKFTEITLYFQEVCSEFLVYFSLENQVIISRSITNNNSLVVSTQQEGVETPNVYIDEILIFFKKTKYPYRYIKLNEIDFGSYSIFNKEIVDINIIDELSIDSSELSANSLTLSIDNTNGEYDILNPKNKLKLLQEQQEITVYHHLKVGDRFYQIPLGTFLLKEFDIKNKTLEIEAYDDTYFMNKIYYGSKFYDNEEITVVLLDLFNYFGYTNHKIDEELIGIKLTGYIPNVEFREALRLIAEAGACVINKTREGQTYIFKTYDPITKTFNRNEIFKENPSRNLFNNVIDLVKYNYSSKTENAEVLNIELEAGQHLVLLDKFPILENTLDKLETNDNYEISHRYSTACVVNVKNKTQVKLKGTLVNVAKSSGYKSKGNISVENSDYSIKKIDNTLITDSNANKIAEWKLNRSEVKYNFSTLIMPYIEVGDTCSYKTRFNTTNTFIPTRLEFSKSVLQYIEGE